MSYSKNTGRKRLGRIAISGPSIPAAKRPCQIVQRNDVNTKSSEVSESHQSFNTDLSFSVSFNDDSTNDLDLMSALDKMECDMGTRQPTKNPTGSLVHVQSNLKDKQSGFTVAHKSLAVKSSNEEITPNSIKSPPHRTDVGKTNSRNKSIRENIDSFLDLSFTSPMEVNTPQVFKKKVDKKSSCSKTVPNCNSATKSRPKTVSSSPAITPRRSTRKKKRVLDCLVNVDNRHGNTADKSDFFKSLVEDISIDDIDDLNVIGKVGESKPVNVEPNKVDNAVVNKKPSVGIDGTNKNTEVRGIKKNIKSDDDVTISKPTDNSNEISIDDIPIIPTRSKVNVSMNSSRRLMDIKPSLGKDQLALSSWDLPETVLKQYESRGITHMFEWQAECLLLDNVLDGGNLVYSAPTSAGKTMVAELLVLKRVIETRKKAIIILPFVSVTREKMFYLQELYQDAGIRVSGFMGHYHPAGGFNSVDVAVCTIEKGNGLINRMLEENKLDQLGIIVVDEMHLIGDSHRGYLLELLLTKIVYMSKKCQLQTPSEPAPSTTCDIQIVGMSATLPNLDLLARWLNAGLYCTQYRPVPLTECVKIGTALYDNSMKIIKDIDITYAVKGDDEHVIPLCIETIKDGHSILIFCPTKNWCEKLAETVAREFYNLLRNQVAVLKDQNNEKNVDVLKLPLDQTSLKDIIEQLRRTPVGIDNTLGRTVPFGVAYHHAGLTFDERDIVEGAFRQGILKVLVATSTLSSGVNLPARRVLIRTPVFHGQIIDFLTYKQMIGRAGRKGVDTAGESILLCKPNERSKAEKLVQGSLPSVHSTLIKNEDEPLSSSLKRAILEVVVSGVATTPDEVSTYASCTLLAASITNDTAQTSNLIEECVTFLEEYEFVCKQNITQSDGIVKERYVPTQLGSAVLSSSISPDEGLVVFSELVKARQCFVLENELHIIYQVTPIYAQLDSIDWYQYFNIWENLSSGMRKVAELVGVQESFLSKAVRGRILTKTSSQRKLLAIHKRFYTALVLHDLVQETPLNEVVKRYNCNKGQLQSLQQSAATFAGMVTVFCARLGWSNLELILSQFQNRLTFGVQRELCDLVRISALNGQRARVMYNGGYQTVAALASAHPADVEALLKNSAPFQSNKRQDCESEWEVNERKKMRCIYLTGRKGVTELEAALAIINEAKSIIQEELGGIGVQWDSNKKQEPCLKSPVLRSPLASNQRKKKQRLSTSFRKNTDPVKQCLKSPSGSMMSPPALTSNPRSTENNCINTPRSKTRSQSTPVIGNTQVEERTQTTDNKMDIKVDTKTDNDCQHTDGKSSDFSDTNSKAKIVINKLTIDTDVEIIKDLEGNSNDKKVLDLPVCIEGSKVDELQQTVDTKQDNAVDTSIINGEIPCSEHSNNVDVDNENKNSESMGDCGKQCDSDLNCISSKSNSNNKGLKTKNEKNVNFSPENVTDKSVSNINKVDFKSATGDKSTKHFFSIVVENEDKTKNISLEQLKVKDNEIAIKIPASVKTVTSNCHLQTKSTDRCNKSSELMDDFGESFILDTQGMESLEKQCTGDMTSKTVVAHQVSNGSNYNIKSHTQTVVDIGDTSQRGEEIMESEIDDSYKTQDKVVVGNDSLDDSFKSTILNGHAVNNGNDISDNVFDMNISGGSDEDMFGNSGDLVAASNYEHVGINDSISDDNNSYEDLHIPYQSGQEQCFENADIDNYHCNGVKINANPVGNFKEHSRKDKGAECGFGQQLKVLGKFSTPISTSPVNNRKKNDVGIHEDLAIALEMGESFSSTFNMPTQINDAGKCDKDTDKLIPAAEDHFSDSLSISMMDKVLEQPIISNQLTNRHENNSVARSNQVIEQRNCDRPNLNNDTSKVKQSEHELDEDSKVNKENVPVTLHRTLRSNTNSANKNRKSQKINDDNKFVIPSGNCSVKNNSITNSVKIETKKLNICITPLSVKSGGKVASNQANVNTSPDLNTSNVSDCVPPTPPGENSVSVTLQSGGGDTPKRRGPTMSSCMSPFSPRLQRKIENKSSPATSLNSKTNPCTDKEENHKQPSGKIVNSDEEIEMTSGMKKCNIVLTDLIASRSGNESDVSRTEEKEHVSNDTNLDSENKATVSDNIYENDNDDDDNDVAANGDVDDNDENILNPSFISPIEAGLPLTQSSFSIIDVCGDRRLFKTFILEWRTKSRYSLSLACEKLIPINKGPGIGANFKTGETPNKQQDIKEGHGILINSLDIKIVGLAISWENRDVYYVSFTNEQPQGDPDDSLAAPPCDINISIAIRIKAVKSVLQQTTCNSEPVVMSMFDIKTHYRCFVEGFGFSPIGQFEDPKVACWMLDPGSKEKNLHRMVTNLLPADVPLLHGIGGGVGVDSLGINPRNPGSGRYRSCIESVLVSHLCEYFNVCLTKEDIYKTYKDVEMPSTITLCKMELNGFGFSLDESESQKSIMLAKLSALEEQAYTIARHPFSLSSADDIAQVLFIELQLPPNGDPNATPTVKSLVPKRGLGPRRGRGRPQYSTSKDILEKLQKLHPLPGIILEWRRITNALTKTVFPLQKEKVYCDWLSMYRIYGDCQCHTATGRISMTEPNLQNVPKDFDIVLPDLIGESPPPSNMIQPSRTRRQSRIQQMIGQQQQVAMVTDNNTGSKCCLSMRNVFIPFKGGVLLAADYSQLELRMISYLSNDDKLMNILNKDGDVFKLITAQWKNISVDNVTTEQRAQAKQVCYGMIYGIGAKTLSEQLDVDENDAAVFIETFKSKYPGMKRYLRTTVELCRKQGYVQTMLGRKRYLPSITSTNPHARSQAERQAINTTVQGSAADLVKIAMIKIDERLKEIFPHVQYTHKQKPSGKSSQRSRLTPEGGYLVLQLHDELIYEVTQCHLDTVAQIVKSCMETAKTLPVKMPVKIKVGPSWGKLEDYQL